MAAVPTVLPAPTTRAPARSRPRRAPWSWGPADGATCAADCGSHGMPGARHATRAVLATASPQALFLWLAQLRRAPYSYDLLDNLGRPSPRIPDPALSDFAPGQRVMTIFTATAVEPGRSLTVVMRPGPATWLFGPLQARYSVTPLEGRWTALRADLCLPRIGKILGGKRRALLAWGDLLMMRNQLRTLRELAEGTTGS